MKKMFKELWKWLISAAGISVVCFVLVSCGERTASGEAGEKFPAAELPSIQVRAVYPGANVKAVLSSVAPVLADSIFRNVRSLEHLSYTASSDGSLLVTVYFKVGTDMDIAGLNVSNVVSAVTGQLPLQVAQAGITVQRQNEHLVMAIDLYAEDGAHYDQNFLTSYVADNIIPEIQHIAGDSRLVSFDMKKDSVMRIWLSKKHMAAIGLTLKEVLGTIPERELEAVTVMMYRDKGQPFDYIIKRKNNRKGVFRDVDVIIPTNAGTILKLKDVAVKVESGPYNYGNFSRINGRPGVSLVIMQSADLKDKGIQTAVRKLMETAAMKFPAGIRHSLLYNPKDTLYISVE
jgi:HAE1 family hydrophobic/amphiphilic exporter-1